MPVPVGHTDAAERKNIPRMAPSGSTPPIAPVRRQIDPLRRRVTPPRHVDHVRRGNTMGLGGPAEPTSLLGTGCGGAPARRITRPFRALVRGPGTGHDPAHLVDRVSRRLGGLTRTWRFDRKATVCHSDFVGSRPASPASPNATAPRWRFAHRGPETAQEWRRRPIPLLPSAGGAPCPTISPSNEPSRGWMSSVVCGATPGCLPPRTEG